MTETTFAFMVHPPWHKTWWAYLIWVVAGGGLAWGAVRWRFRILEKRNGYLKRRIHEATEELRAREVKLHEQAEQLAHLNEEKNHFIGMVAHDLRNPLSGILMSAQLLEDEENGEDRRRLARQVEGEAREMSHLVERFLDIAAIDSGKVAPQPELILVNEVLGHLLARYGPRVAKKQLALQAELPPGDVFITTDRRFLKAVVDNLLSNAVKYSPKGTAIELGARIEGSSVEIWVADHGPGFTDADLERLFAAYTPLSARPTAGEKSTGLGLSIVRRFTEALRGDIRVETTPGGGATFHLRLPLQWPDALI